MAKELQSDEFKKLLLLGEEKGFLTYDDVNDMLPADLTSSDQIDDIIMLFGEKNIDIIDTEQGEKLMVKKPAEDTAPVKLTETLAMMPIAGKTGDPVKMYLREMGLVSLLSREGEVEIAKKIEEGARETMSAIFRLSISINEVLGLAVKLESGEIRIKNVVDNIEDEEGFVEEDEHRERILKLLSRIKLFNDRNNVLRNKLKSKAIRVKQRETLSAELEKNTRFIVTLCRKIRFSKKQINRFIARLRYYNDEIERAEKVISQYKKETKLTLAQLEKAWAKMKKSQANEKKVARENRVSVDLLKKSKAAIDEAHKRIKHVVKEVRDTDGYIKNHRQIN